MKHRSASILASVLLLSALASCGGGETPPADTQDVGTSPVTETAGETAFVYQTPAIDLGGADFPILNTTTTWGFYTTFDPEEQTGETLDDAVWMRNSKVEEAFNLTITGTDFDIGEAAGELRKTVNAGEDVYRAALISLGSIAPLMQEQMLMDLNECDAFRLEEAWWDQEIRTMFRIGSSDVAWFAASELSLTGLECTVVPFFNQRILTSLDLESPYDLVRAGTWTFDKMGEYAKLGANLNGADKFDKYDPGASTQYGIVSYSTFPHAMFVAAGEDYIRLDKNNTPYLAMDSDRFFSVAEKIADLTAESGAFNEFNSGDIHYESIFRDGRALMTVAQVKATTKFRSMEDTFGILPMPKYEESQDGYRCLRTGTSCVVCVPVTIGDMDTCGAVMDAMSYYSYTEVLPAYYDVTLTQKGLRNEDSVEMMNIIRDARIPELGSTFGWTNTITGQIEKQLMNGKSDIASKIAAGREKAEKAITETLDLLAEQD